MWKNEGEKKIVKNSIRVVGEWEGKCETRRKWGRKGGGRQLVEFRVTTERIQSRKKGKERIEEKKKKEKWMQCHCERAWGLPKNQGGLGGR